MHGSVPGRVPGVARVCEGIKEALGEDDTGTFTYVLKAYAEKHNLISENLHK